MSSQSNLKQIGESLHRQLLDDSSLSVTSKIAEMFLPALTKSLTKAYYNINDQHLIETAVEDALLAYFAHPQQFNPARGSLFTFLRVRASSYLLNALDTQRNSQFQNKVVEVDEAEAVYNVEALEDDALSMLVEREVQAEIEQKLQHIVSDPTDFQLLNLMLEGVRETSAYASVLGITNYEVAEQDKLVKQHKDRIKKTVQRKLKIKGK
jgi:DNA-directed RNA polymerase specialized sigma24 family protein